MRKLLYVILLLLFRLLMFPGAVCAEILSLPDSLITDDNVYKYTFSDFDKAQQVMEQLRKRKSLSDVYKRQPLHTPSDRVSLRA